ncbi:MAG: NADH-quinone oxidoreductase subunit F [Nitrospiria bacterium]
MERQRILTERDIPLEELTSVRPFSYETYVAKGGYTGLQKAVGELGPSGVRDAVKASGLRGRGGAGFPTWKKWDMVVQQKEGKRYLCCNAAEDEPGTFKDRYLLRTNPHQLVEGVLISAFAIGADEAYLFINCRYKEEIAFMEEALQAAEAQGYWGKSSEKSLSGVSLKICESPGSYVAGEETALLEVIEGKVAAPRQKPPYYPTMHGLFGKPTVVNNAETLSNVTFILREGPEAFRGVGTNTSSGTMVFTLTGDVERPGLYERPLGSSLRELINDFGGGVKNGARLKGLFPGGPSVPIIPAQQIDLALDFDTLKSEGTGLGTGAVIVMSEETCMVQAAIRYARFFANESCGQCPPCRLGTVHLSEILEKIESGAGAEADVTQVEQACDMVKGRGQCFLLTGAAIAVESILKHFRYEFEDHAETGGCPFTPHPVS